MAKAHLTQHLYQKTLMLGQNDRVQPSLPTSRGLSAGSRDPGTE